MPSSTTPFENALVQFSKTVAASGTPERLSATPRKFRQATFIGYSSARVVNTDSVWLGASSTNDSQVFEVPAGGQAVIEAVEGTSLDFYDIYADAVVNGEGVTILYQA